MKKYKYSLIYIGFLVLLSLFHFKLQGFVLDSGAGVFFNYIVYGLFAAFFLAIFIKSLYGRKNQEIAIVLLVMGLVFFFLLSNPKLVYKLAILEFFVLGLVVSFDSLNAASPLPFLILGAGACLVEFAANLPGGGSFFYLNVWGYSLTGLSGYISGLTLKRLL